MKIKRLILLSVLSCGLCFGGLVYADVFDVTATVETDAVAHGGDSADDAKVWVHPTDPSRSVIIGTDKHDTESGLAVYDLTGRQIFFARDGKMNNVDVRYNFPLTGGNESFKVVSGEDIALALAS